MVEEGRFVAGIAKDFGISNQTLRIWVDKEDKKRGPTESIMIELEHQLKEKQKRIDDLEDTVDISKNVIAIFAQSN